MSSATGACAMHTLNRGWYVSNCVLSSRASSTSPRHFRMRLSSVAHLLSIKEESAVEHQCSSTHAEARCDRACEAPMQLNMPETRCDCHDRDDPPQPSHIYLCLLAVQTPPEQFLTKPKPISGHSDPSTAFPNPSAAFPKGMLH